MTCIVLFLRRPLACDEQRLRRVFLDALELPPGSPLRRVAFLDPGEPAFHVVVEGPDALDCHAYAWRDTTTFRSLESGDTPPDLAAAYREHNAVAYVEPAPIPEFTPASTRRVMLAVAGLVDADTLLLGDWPSGRVVPCGPETPGLLRTADLERVFGGGFRCRTAG